MSITRHSRPTRPGPGPDDALARLLADAAPRHDYARELPREADAVAAFHQARRVPAAASRRRRIRAGKLLTLKAVIAVVGLSGGGVAFAAVTGHLPVHPGSRPAAPASAAPSISPGAAGARVHHPAGRPSPSPRPSGPGPATARPGTRPAVPASGQSAAPAGGTPAVVPSAAPSAAVPGAGLGASAGPVSGSAGTPTVLPVSPPLSPVGKPLRPAGGPLNPRGKPSLPVKLP